MHRPATLPSPRPLRLLAVALLSCLLLGGCSIYRINIQQGNYLDDKTIARVEVGMSRSQVRFVLGTPMVADSFHQDRWDYVFYFRSGRTGDVRKRHVVVFFDGDSVSVIEDGGWT